MGWAERHIERLRKGETIQFRPSGNSMTGRINDGNLVTVEPAGFADVEVGDAVLCRVAKAEYLHLVKAVGGDGRLLIGNNKGGTNGWTRNVYGKVVKVEK